MLLSHHCGEDRESFLCTSPALRRPAMATFPVARLSASCAAQDGGDEAHVVAGLRLLEGLQSRLGIGVQHHGGPLTVVGVLQGQLDGHQLGLQSGTVVWDPHS
ncbi:hypothetical protein E2C01_040205 [Portunus trituberculatus]|uniref:Uncharacterized protein n=1 Tax=Portunus trituberculatus TaxID=210409 RepID=A0A5B7FM01_PORTR|nr:hypothetical protein [Portunus trituberculatus]